MSTKPNIGRFFADHHQDSANSAFDKELALHCRKYGDIGYTFITYPLGGISRYLWKPQQKTNVPPIHLPDLQLQTQFWQKYVNCALSMWIDPDSDCTWLAEISAQQFCKEIEYARYLGIKSVLIELKHANSPRLANLICKFLSTTDFMLDFWIKLPTNFNMQEECNEIWMIWRNFRSLCGNSARLRVGLSFTEDLSDEFDSDSAQLRRWYAEPLTFVHLDYSLFIAADGPKMKLSQKYSKLFTFLIASKNQHVICSSLTYALDESQERQLVHAIQELLLVNEEIYQQENMLADYFDTLQIPLQPLSDNLESSIYQTFEQDKPKYENYQSAIKLATSDLIKNEGMKEIVIIVLGAGRGPLVTASIDACKELEKNRMEFSFEIFAVEKNPNAILSLNYCNEQWWNDSVHIIHSDMRLLAPFIQSGNMKKPDIIVSELLGSFGDNELSPECLDGVSDILKENTICIPQSYQNYLAPIQSLQMYQTIKDIDAKNIKARNGLNQSASDHFYVVCLDQFCFLDEPQPCFEFSHPNREKQKSNIRKTELQFDIMSNSELMGFAGYFDVVLYKNIILSTHPSRHTENLLSWFPVLFPLRELLLFGKKETRVTLNISRNIDETRGCWYEWFIKHVNSHGKMIVSEVQNLKGESQIMKF